ncbi:MAG: SMC-Scp complex subunit ScpB [Pontimonas sp.]|nr:SMC-Scp complex subunit ScpB [Pontimonas sp.]MDR9434819.1 SMC-Scp complex subunit ScpB [Pontimonas sp.]
MVSVSGEQDERQQGEHQQGERYESEPEQDFTTADAVAVAAEGATEHSVQVSSEDLAAALEALLMVADQPLSTLALAQITGRPQAEIQAAVSALRADYAGEALGPRRGFELREIGGGWRIYAASQWDGLVRSMLHDDSPQRLSQQALETLSVIAYKQPVTRSQVSAVRAVNVDSVMRTLIARGLIDEHSNDPETGAIFYQTTPLLLEYLGIESLEELPPLAPLLGDGREGFADVEA